MALHLLFALHLNYGFDDIIRCARYNVRPVPGNQKKYETKIHSELFISLKIKIQSPYSKHRKESYGVLYPFKESKVSPTVYLASSRAQLNLRISSTGHFPLSTARSCEGLTSQKIGITFFLDSIIRASSWRQKYDSQYRGEKTATPTLHFLMAPLILSNNLSPGFIFLQSKKGCRFNR